MSAAPQLAGRGRRERNLPARCTRHFVSPAPPASQPASPASPASQPACSVHRPQTHVLRWKTANPLQPARSSLHIGIRETIPVPEGRPAPSNDSSRTQNLTSFQTDARPAPCNGSSTSLATDISYAQGNGFPVPGIENGEPVRNPSPSMLLFCSSGAPACENSGILSFENSRGRSHPIPPAEGGMNSFGSRRMS